MVNTGSEVQLSVEAQTPAPGAPRAAPEPKISPTGLECTRAALARSRFDPRGCQHFRGTPPSRVFSGYIS